VTTQDGARTPLWETLRRQTDDLKGIAQELPEVASEVRGLFTDDVNLGVAEVKQAAIQTGTALGIAAAGVAIANVGLIFVFLTVMFALSTAMALWLAALITTIIVAVLAAIVLWVAKTRLKRVQPMPKRFVDSVGKDVSWLRSQMKSSAT
jgi:hypothetical protein